MRASTGGSWLYASDGFIICAYMQAIRPHLPCDSTIDDLAQFLDLRCELLGRHCLWRGTGSVGRRRVPFEISGVLRELDELAAHVVVVVVVQDRVRVWLR